MDRKISRARGVTETYWTAVPDKYHHHAHVDLYSYVSEDILRTGACRAQSAVSFFHVITRSRERLMTWLSQRGRCIIALLVRCPPYSCLNQESFRTKRAVHVSEMIPNRLVNRNTDDVVLDAYDCVLRKLWLPDVFISSRVGHSWYIRPFRSPLLRLYSIDSTPEWKIPILTSVSISLIKFNNTLAWHVLWCCNNGVL